MSLGDLIKFLEKQDPEQVLPEGFDAAGSYRGYYEDLGFEPAQNVKVEYMLVIARGCIGKTFTGHKGGEFTMDENTGVWFASYGSTGEPIGPTLLKLWFGKEK